MLATIHDVRGAPVPGLRGVPRVPAPRGGEFGAIIRPLLAPAATARPERPGRRGLRASAPPLPPGAAAAARPTPARPEAPATHALRRAIRTASAHAGVEPALAVAVARAESNLNPRARSSDGLSVGTFQVTYATAGEMRRKIARGTVTRPPGTDDVALGVGYLRYLHDLFGRAAKLGRGLETVPIADPDERRRFAVAAFNAGEGRVAQAQAKVAAGGGDPTRFAEVRPHLPRITQGYVERVIGFARQERPPSVPV